METTDLSSCGKVSVSLSDSWNDSDWESRPTPDPGVGPSSRLLEPADSGRNDATDEDSDEGAWGIKEGLEEGLEDVADPAVLPSDSCHTMI